VLYGICGSLDSRILVGLRYALGRRSGCGSYESVPRHIDRDRRFAKRSSRPTRLARGLLDQANCPVQTEGRERPGPRDSVLLFA
jgi:hypothetical protein